MRSLLQACLNVDFFPYVCGENISLSKVVASHLILTLNILHATIHLIIKLNVK